MLSSNSEKPASRQMVMTLLGIDSKKEYLDSLGRPVPPRDEGKTIPGLV